MILNPAVNDWAIKPFWAHWQLIQKNIRLHKSTTNLGSVFN